MRSQFGFILAHFSMDSSVHPHNRKDAATYPTSGCGNREPSAGNTTADSRAGGAGAGHLDPVAEAVATRAGIDCGGGGADNTRRRLEA